MAEGGGPDAGGGQEAVEAPPFVVAGQGLGATADLGDVAPERGDVGPGLTQASLEEGSLGAEQGLGGDPQTEIALDRALERRLEEAPEDDGVAAVERFRMGVEIRRRPAHVDEREILPARDASGDRADELEHGQGSVGRGSRPASATTEERPLPSTMRSRKTRRMTSRAGSMSIVPTSGMTLAAVTTSRPRRISTTWSRTLRFPA